MELFIKLDVLMVHECVTLLPYVFLLLFIRMRNYKAIGCLQKKVTFM